MYGKLILKFKLEQRPFVSIDIKSIDILFWVYTTEKYIGKSYIEV